MISVLGDGMAGVVFSVKVVGNIARRDCMNVSGATAVRLVPGRSLVMTGRMMRRRGWLAKVGTLVVGAAWLFVSSRVAVADDNEPDSKVIDQFNAAKMGPKKDTVRLIIEEARRRGLKAAT